MSAFSVFLARLGGRRLFAAALAAILAASVSTVATAQNRFEGLNEAEKATLRLEIREYLIEEPEVVAEALRALERKMLEDAVLAAEADVAEGMFIAEAGAPDGALLMIEFTDYDCPWCRRVRPEVEAFLEQDPDVRYVVRVLPRVRSDAPERAAVAASFQDAVKARDFHDAMMAHEGELSLGVVLAMAEAAGLDVARLQADMESDEVTARFDANGLAAARLDIQGTPGFVIGGKVIPGAVPTSEFVRVAAEARAEQ